MPRNWRMFAERDGYPDSCVEPTPGLSVNVEVELWTPVELATKMAHDYGCVGIVVDAKPGAIDFYTQFGFVPVAAVEGLADVRPQQTPMFLSLRAIKAAGAPSR